MKKIIRPLVSLTAFLLSISSASPALALPVKVFIYVFEPTTVSFSFVDGGPQSNTITMSNFEPKNALLAPSRSTGGVTGDFPGTVTISDTSFFNEYQLDLDPLAAEDSGGVFTFILNATNSGPGADDFPDGFSIAVFNALTGLPIQETEDPTGSNSSLVLSINGEEITTFSFDVYTPGIDQGGVVFIEDIFPAPVPAPGSVDLIILGMFLMNLRFRFLFDLVRRYLITEYDGRIGRGAIRVVTLISLAFGGHWASAAQLDVTGGVSVTRSALVLNRATNTFDARITIKNTSSVPIYAPLSVVVDGFSQAITLSNASGFAVSGKPLVNVSLSPQDVLGSDQLVSGVILKFTNPTRTAINVRFRVFAEVDVLPPFVEQYRVVPLGGIFKTATGLNNSGIIIGSVIRARRPVEPRNAQLEEAAYLENGTLVRLGTIDQTDSRASDINDSGQILGQAFTFVSDPRFGNPFGVVRPFRFSNGVLTPLSTDRPDGLTATLNGKINSRGDMVRGQFLYQNDVMSDLDPLFQSAIPIFASWPHPFVTGFNDSSQILLQFNRSFVSGPSGLRTFEFRTFVFSNGTALEINPGWQFPYSFGTDINNFGTVVGGNQAHAYFWQNGISTDFHPKLTNISGNVSSEAKTINNRGQIAGEMFIRGGTDQQHSFLYSIVTGRSIRLNRYFPKGTHFQPFDINDKGQILGNIYCDSGEPPCGQVFPNSGSQAMLDPLN
jgi:uncharacterized membrane protein